MAKLTKEEKEFLKQHDIRKTNVFDGERYTRPYIKAFMKCEGKEFYIGPPCNSSGHRIRTRAGHCAQCDTSRVGFMKRHGATAQVYVAQALDVGLVKVGSAADAYERMDTLNEYDYADSCKWEVYGLTEDIPKAGEVEFRVHKLLDKDRATAEYFKDGAWRDCREVFTCSPDTALDAINEVIEGMPP